MLNYSVAELRYINFWLEVLIFGLSKLLSVICYLLLPFFAFYRKMAFLALFFTANIIPMILPQVQANIRIVLHLTA